jgi:hypothetical protein
VGRDFSRCGVAGLTIAVAGVAIGEVLAIPAIRALASVQAGIRPGNPYLLTLRGLLSG